jgi:hypothetical protein
MNRLILLAATFVLSTGMMFAQSSPAATDRGQPNAAPDQMQRGTPQATPPIVPHQPPETTANPDRPEATPQTTLPSTTIDDQQPGNSTTGSPSSTMGTTGSTPGTDQSTTGNQSGNLPNDTQTPKTDNTPKPKTDTEPHDRYSSGSNNPNSSANGASSDDMSGTTPRPDNSTNSTNPQTTPPHIATHAPDAGTVMNPASVELVTETTEQH